METLTEQITREYEIEQQANKKAVNPDDIPVSYEAITPEWLTHILCKNHPGAKVTGYSLDVPDNGNTNRRRIFVSYNEAGQAADLPGSVFCKALHKLPNRLVDAHCGLIQGEDAFYNRYRAMLDIEAPKCYLANYSKKSFNSILILDDLVRHGAEFCSHDTHINRERVESQLLLLAKMHGRFYESEDVKNSGLLTFKDSVDFADKWFDLEKCCTKGFLVSEEVIPQRLFSRYREVWPVTLKAFELHASMPRTFTHNDPHLRNWYIAPNGQMALCDWQTFAGGHWGRDVAYTISTSLTTENRRNWERELVQFYADQLYRCGGPKLHFDEAWKYYRQHLFDSLAWWTLTIAPSMGDSDEPPPDFQPMAAMLTFIGRMATAIDDLDALSSFD